MAALLFTTSNSLGSRLIRWVTGECCSHVAIEWGSLVLHSTSRGVHLVPSREFYRDSRITHTVSLPEGYSERVVPLLERLAGARYDTPYLLSIGFQLLWRRLIRSSEPLKPLWNHPDSLICTELASELLSPGTTLPDDPGIPGSPLTPHGLYAALSAALPIV